MPPSSPFSTCPEEKGIETSRRTGGFPGPTSRTKSPRGRKQIFNRDDELGEEDQGRAATRITLRPHDPSTGEEVENEEVVKGYEYLRSQFFTFTAEELKALDV